MQIRIETPGEGFGTIVEIDGERVPLVTEISLSITANEPAVLTLKKFVAKEGVSPVAVAVEDGELLTETLQFAGTVLLVGHNAG